MEQKQIIDLAKNAIVNGLPVNKAIRMAETLCKKFRVDCDRSSLRNKIVDGAKVKRTKRKGEMTNEDVHHIADLLEEDPDETQSSFHD